MTADVTGAVGVSRADDAADAATTNDPTLSGQPLTGPQHAPTVTASGGSALSAASPSRSRKPKKEPVPPVAVPRIFAHRGMSSLAPENTLAAFRACADHGVKWFELDVDVLADGTVVVIHDATLDRTTSGTGRVAEKTWDDVKDLDTGSWFDPAFSGERIPTLRQVIELMNEHGLNANIELKAGGGRRNSLMPLVEGVLAELEGLSPEREVLISSFNPLMLGEVRRLRPDLELGCLFNSKRMGGMWRNVGEWLGAAAMHPWNEKVGHKGVQKFRRAGYDVNVWTVNDVDEARVLVEWGATGLFTDRAQDLPEEWRAAQ